MQEHLIVFTRYPEPGKTKTRLIPALGATKAAELQRQMTEHTLKNVRRLQRDRPICLEIRFAGGNAALMADWLGSDLIYQMQGAGDLGAKMLRSLAWAFQNEQKRVVIIGTDCPKLNDELISKAFDQLQFNSDLVLGPAIDGGYYLIGLNRLIPELFAGISWGSAAVFQQTVEIAEKTNLSISYLTELADIDRPEDLELLSSFL